MRNLDLNQEELDRTLKRLALERPRKCNIDYVMMMVILLLFYVVPATATANSKLYEFFLSPC